MMRVGVVIPYYQRDAGILRRALASVAAQDLPDGTTVEVVVVDDASPCPPGPEVEAVAMPPGTTVTLLAQANGGPGAARNRALDHLAAVGCDVVAFLDSDDEWLPAHLREGLAALDLGYDMYFCLNVRDGAEEADGSDAELARLRRKGEPGVSWLADDGNSPALIGVENARLFEAYLAAYCSQTSTVVVRADRALRERFDPRLRSAGEDLMFWFDLVRSGARAAVSTAVNVRCGRGVNIYHASYDFGRVEVVGRVGCVLLFWLLLARKVTDARLSAIVRTRTAFYRQGYSYLFLRALLRRQRPSLALLREVARHDPLILPLLPWRFLSVLPRRAALSREW
jgi:succinoglycan biosynthesis protein ExoW